jgi:prephenate dehydratase
LTKTNLTTPVSSQKGSIIGYLGPQGTFSEEAARTVKAEKYLPFLSIPDLLRAFWSKETDKIVLPIENSIEGIVNPSFDGLVKKGNGNDFTIEREILLPIRQNLIGRGDVSEVKKVISHPQALAQCSKFVSSLTSIQSIQIEHAESTALAVKLIAERGDPGSAAIGTKRAAEIYGLNVIKENIQDLGNNITRFIVLGRDIQSQTGNDKTSLIFELENKPGALVRVLNVFDVLDINMTQIVSRPSKIHLGEYIFWVDIEGHQRDATVVIALEQIKKKTTFFKVLGSYPKQSEPAEPEA